MMAHKKDESLKPKIYGAQRTQLTSCNFRFNSA